MAPQSSGLGSSLMQPPAATGTADPLSARIDPGDMFLRDGRYYATAGQDRYMFPSDAQELDRLDVFHRLFREARGDRLYTSPLPALLPGEQYLFLDIGTGTGIWSIDMAHDHEYALVDGVDLVMIQPEQIYKNQRFLIMDIESQWTGVWPAYHLIYARMLHGAVQHWPSVYENVFHRLKPGGRFEQVEIDFMPRCDDGTLPENSAIVQCVKELIEAMREIDRPIEINSARTKAMMQTAGLRDIRENKIKVNMNGWSEDPKEREIGRWFCLAMLGGHGRLGLHGLTVGPLTRVKGWPAEQLSHLIGNAEADIRNRKYHSYCYIHIYTAERPQ